MSRSNEELAIAYQQGDRAALGALWAQVARLAARMVGRYMGLAQQNRGLGFDDLLQCAFLGVERAARAFKDGAGAFTTVMTYHVKRECRAALGLRGRVRREHYESVPTSTSLGDEGNDTLLDTLEDDSLPDKDERLFVKSVGYAVRRAVARLPQQPAALVRGVFLEGKTLAAVAREQGITPARAMTAKQNGLLALVRNVRLRRLAVDAFCWRHKGMAGFRSSWSSVVEDAVMRRW